MQSQWSTLVLIALMVVAFYFLILRPQKKRQQAVQRTMSELQPGTRVLLGSGLFGTIVAVGDKQAVLEISPGVELTVVKQAIVRTVTDADEDTMLTDDDEIGYDETPYDPTPLDSAGDLTSRDTTPRDTTPRDTTSLDTTSVDNSTRVEAPEPLAPDTERKLS